MKLNCKKQESSLYKYQRVIKISSIRSIHFACSMEDAVPAGHSSVLGELSWVMGVLPRDLEVYSFVGCFILGVGNLHH